MITRTTTKIVKPGQDVEHEPPGPGWKLGNVHSEPQMDHFQRTCPYPPYYNGETRVTVTWTKDEDA
jgi:hypothetical protein